MLAARLLVCASLLALLRFAPGCAGVSSGCNANDECPVATVCRAGQCVGVDEDPHQVLDAGSSSSGDAGNPTTTDAGRFDSGTTTTTDAAHHTADSGQQTQTCQSVDDDMLTAAELPLALNVATRFVEARSDAGVTVDLRGTVGNDGLTTWNFAQAAAGDHGITIAARSLAGLWFADEFPESAYAVPLDGSAEDYAIYLRTETKIQTLGVASAQESFTLLKYDPPVDIVEFPLTLNQVLETTTHVSGTFENNAFYQSTDEWTLTVDARGHLITPAGSFPVLRVRIEQSVTVPIIVFPFSLTYNYIRYSFMTACFSQIAYVAGREGETEPVFTQATAFRRVGLAP